MEAFEAYEAKALELFRECGGEVVARFSPSSGPTEIHVLRIESEQSFNAFRSHPRLSELAGERSSCIDRTELFTGWER